MHSGRDPRLCALLLVLGVQAVSVSADHGVHDCPTATVRELCADATPERASIEIDCHIDFAALDCELASGKANVITKRVLFTGKASSGVSADFDGAHLDASIGRFNHGRGDMLVVRSRYVRSWRRPTDITIRRARITGSIRLYGMGRNAEAEAVRVSSRAPGHVERVRAAAPHDIVLEDLTIVGTGRNPVYFGPGVSNATLRRSTVRGHSTRVGIYLDAESSANTIADNTIAVKTRDASVLGFYDRGWPQLAIDASSDNLITGNRFERPVQGGVFLYRNCGEGGTVRHSSPSRNSLIENVFDFGRDVGNDPAIYVGSRDYGRFESFVPGSHCNDDEVSEVRIGSAASNGDHARDNVIAGNRFIARWLKQRDGSRRKVMLRDLIRISGGAQDTRTTFTNNRLQPR